QLVIESACTRAVVTERLLDHEPPPAVPGSRETGRSQAIGDRTEQRGWNRQVKENVVRDSEILLRAGDGGSECRVVLIGCRVGVSPHEQQALGELIPQAGAAFTVLANRVAHHVPKVRRRPVARSNADDRELLRQALLAVQLEERWQQLATRQVAAGAEEYEYAGIDRPPLPDSVFLDLQRGALEAGTLQHGCRAQASGSVMACPPNC